MGDVLKFRIPGAEQWNTLAALAWHGWQSVGRGVVVMDIQPAGDSKCYYKEKGSPDLEYLWSDDEGELDGMIERYDPHEGFVIIIAYSGVGDEARRILPDPKAPSFLKPPDAFMQVGVGA